MIFASPAYNTLGLTTESGIQMLRNIERAARISHRSEETQTDASWEKFVAAVVIGHGDWSVTEHETVTVEFHVNRGVTHEMVRHRLFGFTQESTRFVNYSKPGYEAVYIPSVAVKEEDRENWNSDLVHIDYIYSCLLYTSDAADDLLCVDLGGRRIIKK